MLCRKKSRKTINFYTIHHRYSMIEWVQIRYIEENKQYLFDFFEGLDMWV